MKLNETADMKSLRLDQESNIQELIKNRIALFFQF